MASPKPSKSGDPSPNVLFGMTFAVFLMFAAIISFTMQRFYPGSLNQDVGGVAKNFILLLPEYAVSVMMRLFPFSFILSLLLIFVIIWSANNLMRLRKQMHDALILPNVEAAEQSNSIQPIVNERWQKVIININSTNQSDWKLAILECDIMLGEILEKMGYVQESISEKLKSIEPSDFTNIENAWEAHKIRNMIAHEGSDFLINEREAKRVIGLYESVFREFEYI
jgi:hypothetical protein